MVTVDTKDSSRDARLAGRASRLNSLTGLRWIAAVLVFVFHLGYVGGSTGAAVHTVVGRAGHGALAFFFILSGFVLTWGARPGDTARGFWRGRFVKIFPNHWATFLLVAVLMLIAGEAVLSGPSMANLFLVQTWKPDLEFWISMNAPSWSLTCEVFFYALFPLLLWLVNKIPTRRLWFASGLALASVVAAPLVIGAVVPGTPVIPYDTLGPVSLDQLWLAYWFPPVRALEFLLGIVLARLVMTGQWRRIGWLPITAVFVVFQIFAMNSPSHLLGLVALPALSVVLVIPEFAARDVRGDRSVLGARWLVWLGEVSFAFYLLHKIVMGFGQDMINGEVWNAEWPLGQWLVFGVITFAITLGLAALLHVFVERPLMRRFAKPRAKRPQATVPPPAP